MIPDYWFTPLPRFLWQVALHSTIMGLIFYVWVHRVDLPSGRSRRHLLALLLVMPLCTAAIPGRAGVEFSERFAWFNSARILAVPLPGGFHVFHLVLLAGLMVAALTIWQEVLPSLRSTRVPRMPAPESLLALVRGMPGWEACAVWVSPQDAIQLATGGWPGRPQLIVSRGAIESLTAEELAIVVAHEHAHWQGGRWWRSQALFAVRLLQCFSPAALWVFREYCSEVEIGCDAAAVTGRDPRLLVRVLLKIYQATDRRDLAGRAALRKRVDVLMAGGPRDTALPPLTIAAASVVMLVVLPWIV